jgi:hypothetical protein
LIDVQHILHRGYKRAVLLGRNDPLLLDVGFEHFFCVCPRASILFFGFVGHRNRRDMLASLRVLLLEKMAQEITPEIEPAVEAGNELELV